MQIKTISGHLTQTEKTHLKAIFKDGLMEAKVNRKNYFLSLVNDSKNIYIVNIVENYKEGFEAMAKNHVHKSKFELKK